MSTLAAALRNTVQQYPGGIAIQDPEASFTWQESYSRIKKAVSLLHGLGLSRGNRFGILALNSFRQAELIYAGYNSGIVPVPINFRLSPREISQILAEAGCEKLFLDPVFNDLLLTTELKVWQEQVVILSNDVKTPGTYETLLLAAEQAKEYEIEPDMEALLLFTGGTSGMPKGVPLTHRNIISNANQIGQRWKSARDDVVLHIPPMFHSADLVKTIYMIKGATQVYLPRFEPEFLLQTIEKFRVTFILLVPTMLMMTLESGLLEKYDLSSLRRMIYGASPMSADWIRRARQAFPDVEIAQGYGLTETSPLLSMLAHDEHTHALEQDNFNRLSSCGRPLPGVEIRIIGDDGNKMPTGEAGEIIVKGDNVFKGYINQAELNTETLNNGWFHTGDIGYFDDEGFLYLLDRKKDMIVCGGENVYSGEVETILDKHPRVLESAVIGIPDEILVERVEAVVVLDPGQEIKETELIDFCRKYIAGYKLPKKIHTVDSMPKSALGKILKTELRKKYSVS